MYYNNNEGSIKVNVRIILILLIKLLISSRLYSYKSFNLEEIRKLTRQIPFKSY